MEIIFQIVGLVYSVVIHELSHGLAALSMGDTTARDAGRLTLNPFKHLDWFGSVLLPFITSQLGFTFGYAKPVPYNPYGLDDPRWGPAKVALAGPASNILLAVFFGLLVRIIGVSLGPIALQLMLVIVVINLVLAFFNLLPVPPLDGHWLLLAVLPRSMAGMVHGLYQYSLIIMLAVIWFVFPFLVPVVLKIASLLTGQVL